MTLNLPPPRSTEPLRGAPPTVRRERLRRRPSGEPPPLPRQLNVSGKSWLVLVAATVVFSVVLALNQTTNVLVTVVDQEILSWFVAVRSAGLTVVMKGLGLLATPAAIQGLLWINVLVLVIFRRWRHLIVWLGVLFVVTSLTTSVSVLLLRPRPFGVEILGDWREFAMPSLPMAACAAMLMNALYSLVPAGRPRQIGKLVVGMLLVLTGLSRAYLAQDAPSDIVTGAIIGVGIPLAAFRLFAPNEVFPVTYRRGRTAHLDITGPRHDAIVRALEEQLGVIPVEVKPFGLAGSGGSTPLRVRVKGDPDTYLFAKLYAATHLRSDRWYKLGRTLMYGRLEDEKPFNTVRRLVQYEDYVLRLLRDAGLPTPQPYGIVEITPEREYLLVTEFAEDAVEIGDAEVDDSIIDQGLEIVRRLWDAGLAHRDIKPANLLVRDRRLLLIDPAFTEVRPSPWRQAVDLGNMMLVLALRSDARQVYERARLRFSDDEIAEAFAATRGLTMPSQLRRLMRQQGRDLHAEFVQLLPVRLPPVRIQRWSWRRVALTAAVLVGAFIAIQIAINILIQPVL
jgi:tRNA A-37 threonylcarbamoyl transferase component Bud32/membrane-associated phospholipid phosphatase